MKPKSKKYLYGAIILVLVMISSYLGVGGYQYWSFLKTADAVSGLPWQDAGKISYVQMGCTRSCLGKCCCSMCDAACEGTTEVQFTGQKGTMFMCVPPTVNVAEGKSDVKLAQMYKGGCAMPTIGMNVIAGGISNVMPTVVGCPTTAGNFVGNLIEGLKGFFTAI